MSISRPLLPAFIQTFLLLHWRIHIRITVLSKFKANPHKNPIPKLCSLIGHWNKKCTITRILYRDKIIQMVIKVFLISKCLIFCQHILIADFAYIWHWICSTTFAYLHKRGKNNFFTSIKKYFLVPFHNKNRIFYGIMIRFFKWMGNDWLFIILWTHHMISKMPQHKKALLSSSLFT